jgi:anti-sigma regulatory factor (Ser/Thr protein kinase)
MQEISLTTIRSLPAVPESVAAAREAMAEFAVAGGAGPERIDAVRLAVSEAFTNAVIHGYRGAPGEVGLSAEFADGQLALTVSDAGVGMHSRPVHPGLGLGLGIIARLCDEMTLVERATGGTEVRMRFGSAVAKPVTRPRICAGDRTPA